MPELTDAVVTNSSPEMSSIIENLQKHALNSQSRQNVINSSSSSVKETSSSSQQVNNIVKIIGFFFCYLHCFDFAEACLSVSSNNQLFAFV